MLLRTANNDIVNLIRMGLSTRSVSHPVHLAEINLEDGKYVIQQKGLGAPKWELSGEYPATDRVAGQHWARLIAHAQTRFGLYEQNIYQSTIVEELLAYVWVSGAPRLDHTELVRGRGVSYKWKLSLLQDPQLAVNVPREDFSAA